MSSPKHITDQRWSIKKTDDNRTLIVGEDGSEIAEMKRPDPESDSLVCGYICGMQLKKLADQLEKKG